MSIQAVVFDLGKVLVDFDYGIAAHTLARQSTQSAEAIRTIIDQSPLLFRYEGGGMTTEEFFGEVQKQIGFSGSLAEFAAAFGDIFTEMPAMTRLTAEVRARGVPTFILSNTNEIAIGHIRRNFPFFAGFTDYIFSYECDALKPHARIYKVTEERTRCRGGEILFLDDKPENVAAAAERGWQTICHYSAEESTAKVRELIPAR